MQLDKIEAVVRPRTSWEAIDLGFCMVQRWAWDFYRIWFVLTLPLYCIIYLLSSLIFNSSEIFAPIITWWLKPVYDRIILHFFSHALFGERITLRQMWRDLPQLLLKTQLLLSLTLYRLSPVRSFTLPIWQLEGGRGKQAKQRFKVLQQNAGSTATWLTVTCIHFQILLVLLFYGLVFMFLPENTDLSSLFFNFVEDDSTFFWLDLIFNYIALSLIEPFYVAGGFALYLNRRTHLEAWDIELTFRQIRQKIALSATTMTLCLATIMLLFLTLHPTTSMAQELAQPEHAKQYIEEVLQQPEFKTTEQQQHWQYIGDINIPEDELGEDYKLSFSWISLWARLFEVLLWVSIAILAAWLVYQITKHPKVRQWIHSSTEDYQPQVNLEPILTSGESPLSLHITQEAWQLWEQQQYRQAISLLYRGSLSQLQQHYALPINDSATENECIRLVRRTQSVDLARYFAQLTRAWQLLAYGKHLPETAEVKRLCEKWRDFFH